MSEQPPPRPPRVDWRYEEVVLVCDVVASDGWRELDRRTDGRVEELSRLLRRASPVEAAANPRFRNANGVGHKSVDIATAHPEYERGQTKGGETTQQVVNAFVAEPARMHELAVAIRAAIEDPSPVPEPVSVDEDETFAEGRTFERRHAARERDPRVRQRKIKHVRQTTGWVRCEACSFDFEAAYGERGRDFIECHHRNPLSVSGPTRTSLGDLALLCSNCHRMIHRATPWLTVEQLTLLVRSRQAEARQPSPA